MFSDRRNSLLCIYVVCVSLKPGMELNGTTGIIFCISFHGFGKVFLQETICFLRGDKFYPASAPSHALRAQCSEWNVDYRIHPTLFHSRFKLCRTIFEN